MNRTNLAFGVGIVLVLGLAGCPGTVTPGGGGSGGGGSGGGVTGGGGGTGGGSTTSSPMASRCVSSALACFDELSAKNSDLVRFRPATRWASTSLTWRLNNTLTQFSETVQLEIVRRAFDAWGGASALSFTEVSSGDADITLSFESGDHGDMFPFAGVDGTLGHAFFPSSGIPGVIHLNSEKDWSTDGGGAGFDLFTAVMHEIGHSLGVEHVSDENAVMSQVFVEPKTGLTLEDVDSIQRLYGDNDNKIIPAMVMSQSFEAPRLVDDDEFDSDGDGIPDSLEVLIFGTDPLNADTDGDGASDFDEIFLAITDPLFGVGSGSLDSDGDGMFDDEEVFFGTDPLNADTDGDGLDDYSEALFYGTDPTRTDTDGDGVLDGVDEFPTNPFFFGPGTDPCAVNGLYGDGVCDLNCFSPDPDCDGSLCQNDCPFAFDGECDDGGVGAVFDVCAFGSDCSDCGPRGELQVISCQESADCAQGEFCAASTLLCTPFISCSNNCMYAFDGECDDGGVGSLSGVCTFGEDCSDCGQRDVDDIPFACESNDDCDDGDACTVDFCDATTLGCVNEPLNCDDGDLCTNDICDLGSCANIPLLCDVGEVCDFATGLCVSANICFDTCMSAFDGECDDGGVGALFDVCEFGTDCFDCGVR